MYESRALIVTEPHTLMVSERPGPLVDVELMYAVNLFFSYMEHGLLDSLLTLASLFSIFPALDKLAAPFLPPNVTHFKFEMEVWLPADVPDQKIEFSGIFGGKQVNYTMELFTAEETENLDKNCIDSSAQNLPEF